MSDGAPAVVVEEGLPSWVMTFADLMSLLMCFFVLLLAFSEMDVSKYKEMAGSMRNAFGVQREIKVKEPPKGINVIAREFSPGRPEPTIMNVIRQMTTSDKQANLDLGKQRRRPVPTPKAKNIPDKEKSFKPHESAKNKADQQAGQKAGQKADLKAGEKSGAQAQRMPGKRKAQADGLTKTQQKALQQAKKLAAVRLQEKLKAEQMLAGLQAENKASMDLKSASKLAVARAKAERRKKLEKSARLISNALGKEIKAGSVDVEVEGQKIIIRIREKASFGSGRAQLKEAFRPLLGKVTKILKDSEGQIVVAGHTDDIPIYTKRFRSNWELSSARAVSVAHEMMLATSIPSSRFLIQGYADTKPVVPNTSAANRSRNRRVEIILLQGEDKEAKGKALSAEKPLASKPVQRQTGKTVAALPKQKAGKPAPKTRSKMKPETKVKSKPEVTGKTGLSGIKVGGER